MEDIKIAVCIPTYDRSQIMKEFLESCSADYANFGIDIYIYDSSTNDETENMVMLWKERLNGLYYIRVPSCIHANIKVFKIFQQQGLKNAYDFIWVCGDSLRFSEKALSSILQNVTLEYDMIEVNANDVGKLGTRVYNNHNDYFRDCAWHLALFGAVILNVKTMLSNVDWNDYELNYSSKELINFSHVSFYFNKLATKECFKALHLSLNPSFYSISPLKEKSGWHEETFYVMCHGWVQTIKSLPSCYKDKKEAMINHGKYTIFKTLNLLKLREDGYFNMSIYKQYRCVWKEVCDIPIIKLYMIALMPVSMSRHVRNGLRYLRTYKGKKYLKRFIRKYPEIIIFGAGKKALKYGKHFNEENIPYSGYCVTESSGNDIKLLGHPVYRLADIEESLNKVGIVLALNPVNAQEVIKMLQARGLKDNVFYNDNLYSV
ncbi:MAG: hypothetical protein LBS02_20230 [Hungatella sp.]|jgi:hypothetical protein|nr:hypothetical protein [Hungatella sp.]